MNDFQHTAANSTPNGEVRRLLAVCASELADATAAGRRLAEKLRPVSAERPALPPIAAVDIALRRSPDEVATTEVGSLVTGLINEARMLAQSLKDTDIRVDI